MAARAYCTFYIADLMIGIDAMNVQCVMRGAAPSPVPLAPKEIRGLLNLRGRILPALDLREKLDLDRNAPASSLYVVIESGETMISLLADRAGDMVYLEDSDFETLPSTFPARMAGVFPTAFRLNQGLGLKLDPRGFSHADS